jgi:hypothetical protein
VLILDLRVKWFTICIEFLGRKKINHSLLVYILEFYTMDSNGPDLNIHISYNTSDCKFIVGRLDFYMCYQISYLMSFEDCNFGWELKRMKVIPEKKQH